jgi:hypothetical protein
MTRTTPLNVNIGQWEEGRIGEQNGVYELPDDGR